MGRLRAKVNHAPHKANGVELGKPTVVREDGSEPGEGDNIADLFWQWDDSRYPDGFVDDEGTITVEDVDAKGKKVSRTLQFDAPADEPVEP